MYINDYLHRYSIASKTNKYTDRAKSQSSQSTLPTKKLSTGVEVVDWEKAKAQGLASTAPAKTTETRVSLNTGQKTNKTKVSNDSTYTPKEQTQSQTETKAQAPQSTLPTKKLSTGVEVVDWEKAKAQGLASTAPAKTTETTLSEKKGFQSSFIQEPSAKSALQMQTLKPTREPVSGFNKPYFAGNLVDSLEKDRMRIKSEENAMSLGQLQAERERQASAIEQKFYTQTPVYSQETQGTKYQVGTDLELSKDIRTGINIPFVNINVPLSNQKGREYISETSKLKDIEGRLYRKMYGELPTTESGKKTGLTEVSRLALQTESTEPIQGTTPTIPFKETQELRLREKRLKGSESRIRESAKDIGFATSGYDIALSTAVGAEQPAAQRTLDLIRQREQDIQRIEEIKATGPRAEYITYEEKPKPAPVDIKPFDINTATIPSAPMYEEPSIEQIKTTARQSIAKGVALDAASLGLTAGVAVGAVKLASKTPFLFKTVQVIDKLDDISDVVEIGKGVASIATGNVGGVGQSLGNVISGNIVAGKVSSKVASGIDFSGVAPKPKAPLFDRKIDFEFKEKLFDKSYVGQKIISTPEGTIFAPDIKLNADAVKVADTDYILAQSIKKDIRPEGGFELSKTTTETEIFSAPEFKKLVSKRSFTPEAKQTEEFYSSISVKPIGVIKGETILDLDTNTFSRRPEGVKDIIRAGPLGISKGPDIRQTISKEIGITERTIPITDIKSQYEASDRAARINPFITKKSTVTIEGRLSKAGRDVKTKLDTLFSFGKGSNIKDIDSIKQVPAPSKTPKTSSVKPQTTEESLILETKEKPLAIVFESDIKPSIKQDVTLTQSQKLKVTPTASLKSKTTPKYESKTYSLPTLTTPSPVLELEKELKLSPSPTLRLDTALLPDLDLNLDTKTITQTINENTTGKTPSLTPDSKLTKTKYPKNYRGLVPRGRSAREFTVTNKILDITKGFKQFNTNNTFGGKKALPIRGKSSERINMILQPKGKKKKMNVLRFL